MAEWTLGIGKRIKRTELHRQFGGSRQSGISPSAQSPNVFIFSDPASGEKHGYFDRWRDDGCFHYTGEGQRGDQQMIKGNLAILNAEKSARALRLFKGCGGDLLYEGRFALDTEEPWYRTDAPETNGGPIRSVIVFRLRPLDTAPEPAPEYSGLLQQPTVVAVPIEERFTEKMTVEPAREPYAAERRESALVHQFCRYMTQKGHIVERFSITPAGEGMPIFTDIYVRDLNLLIEAKGSTDRGAVRMAIGQLLDYSRFAPPGVACAILVPLRLRQDLIALVAHAGMHMCYPTADGFALEDAQGEQIWL